MIKYLKLMKTRHSKSFKPYNNKEKLEKLIKKINLFSLELLPMITRAQSMDILSSRQIFGYKAVIESLQILKAIPMMMTARSTVPAVKV